MIAIASNTGLVAGISAFGAELQTLRKNGHEYLWEGDLAIWGKHSPVLFPIVGSLKNGSYSHKGKSYELPRHGLARDLEFEVAAVTTNSASFSLRSNQQTLSVYPFAFELTITYTFDGGLLQIKYEVINLSNEPMPFNLGAHPAFAIYGDFGSHTLEFDKDSSLQYTLLENGLLSKETRSIDLEHHRLKLNHSLFDNDALVIKEFHSRQLTLANENAILKVYVDDFPNLGLWTKPGAPFLCIEPWLGYSDAVDADGILENKKGILIIAPGERFEAGFRVEIL